LDTFATTPVVLFAYARPDLLQRTLACLRENHVPLIYAFSDGPATPEKGPAVAQVRELLRAVDWCQTRLVERPNNLGLGLSIRTGVAEVFKEHESLIVFEDDLICVPGTYDYLCAALRRYRDDPRVMSVTAWTHARVTPPGVGGQPYFDGRAECWVWGAWRRSWAGMEATALEMIRACEAQGIDPWRYGADLPSMAERELKQNIWAVRFLYLHILRRALCLRPPWSMVEHIGFDPRATNAATATDWANPPFRPCPPLPTAWPEPVERRECSGLWRKACGGKPVARPFRWAGWVLRLARQAFGVVKRRTPLLRKARFP